MESLSRDDSVVADRLAGHDVPVRGRRRIEQRVHRLHPLALRPDPSLIPAGACEAPPNHLVLTVDPGRGIVGRARIETAEIDLPSRRRPEEAGYAASAARGWNRAVSNHVPQAVDRV